MIIQAKTTTDPDLRPLADLPAMLDLAAFEQVDGPLFRAIGELPSWIDIPPGVIIDLADRFPMLELFLPQCEERWQGHSDPWKEPDGSGGECYLQAAAALVHQRRFLVLQTLPTALQTYQQLAHDFELEKDKVERLSAELGAPPQIIATGGQASMIRAGSRLVEHLDEDLTLKGLRLLWERN